MDLFLETQESHFEDVEEIGVGLEGLEAEIGETGEGILESIEKNSNAVREKVNRIVGAAKAATSAALGVVQVVGIVVGIAGVVALLLPKLYPKKRRVGSTENCRGRCTGYRERCTGCTTRRRAGDQAATAACTEICEERISCNGLECSQLETCNK